MRWVKAVKAGLGGVRNGMVGRGEVRLGGRVLVRHGKVWCGPVWLVKVRRSRRGKSWCDMAGYGKAVGAGHGAVRWVKAVEVRRDLVRRGMVWRSINLILTKGKYYNGKF